MDKKFEDIYIKYYESIYRYLLSMTKNADVAEEITQETFYKAFKNIDKYDANYKMFTWLCNIAKNSFYSLYQRSKKTSLISEDIVDRESDIIDHIITSETNVDLLKIIHNLEEPYKEVFTLRVYGNLSFATIGNIFGKTESWARVTYYRSKLKIREKIR